MNRKEWLIWLATVFLIVLAATLPINVKFAGGEIILQLTFFEWIRYLWVRLFTGVAW